MGKRIHFIIIAIIVVVAVIDTIVRLFS